MKTNEPPKKDAAVELPPAKPTPCRSTVSPSIVKKAIIGLLSGAGAATIASMSISCGGMPSHPAVVPASQPVSTWPAPMEGIDRTAPPEWQKRNAGVTTKPVAMPGGMRASNIVPTPAPPAKPDVTTRAMQTGGVSPLVRLQPTTVPAAKPATSR
jgi:hypothetical protein